MTSPTPQHKPPNFAALKNVAAMMNLVTRLRAAPMHLDRIGVFYGPSGWGKSRACRYARNKTNAAYVEVKDTWTRKYLLRAILFELGIQMPRGTLADLEEQAIRLLGEEINRPLIIDEADKLVDKGMIELVRSIYDGSQAPVVLVGEEALPTKLMRIERVHRRVSAWAPAQPCDLEDTRKLAAAFYPGIQIEEALLARICGETRGNTGRIVSNLANVEEWARNSGQHEVTLAAFDRPLMTGEPPTPRTSTGTVLPMRRRAS